MSMEALQQRPIYPGKQTFDMDEPDIARLADQIAEAAKDHLTFIGQHPLFAESYRLELMSPDSKQPNLWRMDLLLHPVAWYHHLQNTINDEEKVVETAMKYVEELRRKVRTDLGALEKKETTVFLPKYCDKGKDCWHLPERTCQICGQEVKKVRKCGKSSKSHSVCEKPHGLHYCGRPMKQSDGSEKICQVYVMKELLLFPDREEKPRYYMASRRELVRELLVTPTEHVTNETFVTDVMVWQFIIRALRKELLVSRGLGIDGIAVNFGKWESAQAMDKYAQECHAHIHLHLTANASEELEQKYSSLKGRTGKPQDYNMENCQLLETTWLLSSLTSLTLHQLREVKEDVDGVKEKLTDMEIKLTDMEEKLTDMEGHLVEVKALLDPRKLVLSLTEALKEVQKNDTPDGHSDCI